MFKSALLLALAAYVVADETISLTAEGDVSGKIVTSGDKLVIGDGNNQFVLEQPDGYLEQDGNYVQSSPEGLILSSKDEASRTWGYADGLLRINVIPQVFYACEQDGTQYISGVVCQEGFEQTQIQIRVNGGGEASEDTSSAPATTEATSSAPATTEATSSAPATTEETSSAAPTTLVSSSAVESSTATVPESFTGGAASNKAAAGLAGLAAAALLI